MAAAATTRNLQVPEAGRVRMRSDSDHMILSIDHYTPMMLVYELSRELRDDPERIALVQALTLNPQRPRMGLKGTHGLFGSEEWWSNIHTGRMRTKTVRGTIEELYFAGQDARWGDEVNSFRLRTEGGSLFDESIRAQSKEDRR